MKKILLIGILAICSCSDHGDLPPAIEVQQPPVPANLTVETVDFMTFQLSWEIDDPSKVEFYRVYSDFEFSSPVLEDSTALTSVQVSSSIALPGIIFCVSAVTPQHVESALICKAAE